MFREQGKTAITHGTQQLMVNGTEAEKGTTRDIVIFLRYVENQYREKTLFQKTREAEVWEEIERVKAKKRQQATQNNNSALSEVEHCPPQGETGKSRDIIAEKVGISSGTTYNIILLKYIDIFKFGQRLTYHF